MQIDQIRLFLSSERYIGGEKTILLEQTKQPIMTNTVYVTLA